MSQKKAIEKFEQQFMNKSDANRMTSLSWSEEESHTDAKELRELVDELKEELRTIKEKGKIEDTEIEKLRGYAKAGKHYKDKSRSLKKKLEEATVALKTKEAEHKIVINEYQAKMTEYLTLSQLKEKTQLCKFHIKTILDSVTTLSFLNTTPQTKTEFSTIEESCKKLS